jgi:hypothetical protein
MATENKSSRVTTTFYNKATYYMFVHSLRKKIGAQLYQLFANEDK